ncbi:uncharacterized protein LOC126588080 [Malus sylvestris]|uniref:uncharacterized protein LOC126588080 n=1 Tax=Malus sylvestris TaxID=3752 RepID=UPI0021AD4E9C|nr:uncharacterized protein LOC126588080 [Malus sylvestris]
MKSLVRSQEARSASLEVFGRKNTEIDKFKVWPELSRHFPANTRRVRSRVSGDLRGFRGRFRPHHGELGVVQGEAYAGVGHGQGMLRDLRDVDVISEWANYMKT